MTAISITGFDLTPATLTRIARDGAAVRLDAETLSRMEASRAVVQATIDRNEPVYGLTTSVGAKTSVPLDASRIAEFNRRLLKTHNMGHGPKASHEVVRAMLVVLLNSMASGSLGVRPVMGHMVADAINSGRMFEVHVWGSMGQSDMSPISDLALALFKDFSFEAGEALALLNSSALAIGTGAMAAHDLACLLDLATLTASLSMEGYSANPSTVSTAALASRDFSGLQRHGKRIRSYLEGSYLFAPKGPRHLQDPLCFRSIPQVHGTAADAFGYAFGQVEAELRSSQNNPVVSIAENKMVSVANFDTVAFAMALDIGRIAFSPLLTSSTERVAKLADAFWSGLSVGLIEEDGVGLPGFNGVAQFHKSITSEARLLAAPVVTELASSSHSNGNLDRASMSGLAARRATDLSELAFSIISMEMLVAAQAIDLRGVTQLGKTTARLYELVRSAVPYAAAGHEAPNVVPLLNRIREDRNELISLIGSEQAV